MCTCPESTPDGSASAAVIWYVTCCCHRPAVSGAKRTRRSGSMGPGNLHGAGLGGEARCAVAYPAAGAAPVSLAREHPPPQYRELAAQRPVVDAVAHTHHDAADDAALGAEVGPHLLAECGGEPLHDLPF